MSLPWRAWPAPTALVVVCVSTQGVTNRDVKLENTLLAGGEWPAIKVRPGGGGSRCGASWCAPRGSAVSSSPTCCLPAVQLCDFGFSKDQNNQSAPTSRVGTPAYLAPEVITSQPGQAYDAKVRHEGPAAAAICAARSPAADVSPPPRRC